MKATLTQSFTKSLSVRLSHVFRLLLDMNCLQKVSCMAVKGGPAQQNVCVLTLQRGSS